MEISMKKVKETLRTILGNRASGVYSVDDLQKIREDEKARDELSCRGAEKMTESIWDREDFKNAKWWKKLWMFVVEGLTNKRGEGHIPDNVIKDIARFLLPNIKEFFESEEGKLEFEKWKVQKKNAAEKEEIKKESEGKPRSDS